MALMTIRLLRNPQTGKQTVVVKLDSDADALPIEHEQLHRELVEKLVGKGLNVEDLGEIVIEREGDATPQEPAKSDAEPEKQAEKAGRGR
jgi:hypothetical protein